MRYAIAGLAGLVSLVATSPIDNFEKRAGGGYRVRQVTTGSKVLKDGPIALQKALGKFNVAVPTNVQAAAQAAGSVTASPEQYDSEYLCPVTLGSNTLNLDFDTGSADLWVFSDLLPSSERSGHAYYKTSNSKKIAGDTWSISYGDGSGASGVVYADKVVIAGVTATSQAVEAATSISTQFVQDTNNDGLVGLAFSTINTATKQATTFFDTVKATLPQALFAADLRKGAAGSYDFGFIDTSAYTGDLVYTDVDSSQGFWTFTTDGFAIGSTTSTVGITGIADTGTSLLLLDDSVVAAYYKKVKGAKKDNTQGGYVFPCNASLPSFSIIIDGETRTVPGSYINYAPLSDGSTTCYGGIQSDSGIGFSIFGDIFLKSQYVVFDESTGSPRLGFGQQK